MHYLLQPTVTSYPKYKQKLFVHAQTCLKLLFIMQILSEQSLSQQFICSVDMCKFVRFLVTNLLVCESSSYLFTYVKEWSVVLFLLLCKSVITGHHIFFRREESMGTSILYYSFKFTLMYNMLVQTFTQSMGRFQFIKITYKQEKFMYVECVSQRVGCVYDLYLYVFGIQCQQVYFGEGWRQGQGEG
eukprot:TRINITY_DN2396_c0_g1_i10.p5 TRINITY_DN2396_c0_g1~~TRINITY_DN2396_c0_g1_i10.p5  ORF type:complete len:187 (-),score=0.40 TRINITY_DN2396_c0_g1_i10:2209-2769(-)